MKQVYTLIVGVIFLCYFSACQQKMICPAYHSYFILDVDETRKTFSLFGPDSLPIDKWEVDKEKYGIAKEISYQKKLKEMRIISMNSIYKKIEDPFAQFHHEFAEADSMTYLDSASVIADSKGHSDFENIDQMIYLHHFGKYLPAKNNFGEMDAFKDDLKPEEEPMIQEEVGEEDAPKEKKKWGIFGRKKKKAENQEEKEEPTDE
jgi:hypothetical protein